jgi:hypothetical protein
LASWRVWLAVAELGVVDVIMTLHTFTKNLLANGYVPAEHPCLFSHHFTSGSRSLVVDNVRGGAYRLFLGWNCIPACHPATAAIDQQQIDAESPWFEYDGKEQKSEALDRCWQWLQSVGFPFLVDPFSRELHRWITEENILIRDRGVIIPIPRMMKLP